MAQIRIGIIGVGGRGVFADNWHKPEGKSVIVGGADISQAYLEEFKNRIGGNVFITEDYRKLLEREDVDAIAVTSPDFCHEEHAIAALQAGKHVFCEKPLAITTEGCDNILKAWKASGKHLMVGFNMRYMDMFRTMKEIVDSGAIGEIKAVWVRHFVGHGGDYYFHDWHGLADNTTSLLLQKGAHDIDIIHWITGKYSKKVAAFGSLDFFGGERQNDLACHSCPDKDSCTEAQFNSRTQCVFRKEINVEDNNVVIMELEGGIKASYLQCHFTPDYHRNYVFIGTKGRLENSEPDNKIYLKTRRSGTWQDMSDVTYDIKPPEGSHGGGDPKICRDFIDMILDNKPPVATPLAGRMSVAVGCAATESIRAGGKIVEIKPLNL